MAHFAKIINGTVEQVIVVHNNELLVNGVETESKGAQFCHDLLGGEWVQCSYNNRIRKQYPSAGYTYDKVNDVFIAPQPYPSWILDENHDWQPPVPMPTPNGQSWDYCTTDYCGHHHFVWFEPNRVWIELV